MSAIFKKENFLITGGTGLIGTHLIQLLKKQGYDICCLSRTKNTSEVETYLWNPASEEI